MKINSQKLSAGSLMRYSGWLTVSTGLLCFVLINIAYFATSFENLISYFWDDTFYYTEIAKNIAMGLGPTADGINPTNGFQPLWALVLVPFFALFEDSLTLPIWILMGLQIIFVSGGVLVLFAILKPTMITEAAIIGALLPLWPGFNLLIGQEQALFFGIHVILAYVTIHDLQQGWAGKYILRAIVIGICSGLLFLTRTDGLFMLSSLWIAWAWWNYRTYPSPFARLRKTGMRTAFMLLAAAPMGLGYIIWNINEFGHVLPISSSLKSTFPHPGFDLSRVASLKWFYLCGIALAVFLIVYLLCKQWHSSPNLLVTAGIGVGALANLGFITFFIDWAVLGNQAVVLVVPTALAVSFLLEKSLRLLETTIQSHTHVIRFVFVFLFFVILLTYTFLRIRNIDQVNLGIRGNYRWVQWVVENTEQNSVFAYTDSTALGYFSERNVINLDGLVNNWEFQDYLHQGQFDIYAQKMGVDYLVTRWAPGEPELRDCLDYFFVSRLDRPVLRVPIALPREALVFFYQFPSHSPRFGLYLWTFQQVYPYRTCGDLYGAIPEKD